MTFRLSETVRNAMLVELRDFAGNGALIRIYTGTQPGTGGGATSETLLGTLTCDAPFAPDPVAGVLTLSTIIGDADADADGVAGWFRMVKADGTTWVMDGSCGVGSGDLQLDSSTVTTGVTINVTSFTITAGQ